MDALEDNGSLSAEPIISWVTLEDAARSWESAVDMVAARIPANISPAMTAGRLPMEAIFSAILIIILWLSPGAMGASAPEPIMALPIMPISTAMPMEITTQMEATRRERDSFCGSSIAMNRSKIWGIPK